MNREQVIATLRAHELELKQAGVVRLSLFGSRVRGDYRSDSDVDLLAAFDETRRISLLDVVGIQLQLSECSVRRLIWWRKQCSSHEFGKAWRLRLCVPSKDPIQRLEDILVNVMRIEEFTAGMDFTRFVEDRKTSDAVERCLERISEAAKKLTDVAEELCPDVPWSKVRGLGNLLRHEYDRIDVARLWLVVDRDLPPLKSAVLVALEELRKSQG